MTQAGSKSARLAQGTVDTAADRALARIMYEQAEVTPRRSRIKGGGALCIGLVAITSELNVLAYALTGQGGLELMAELEG